MKYPIHCDTNERKENLLKAIADNCHDGLKKGDNWWCPYKNETLLELLSFGKIGRSEYDYIRKNQREWEEHYRTHHFSHDRATQDRFNGAYNYRDW